MNFDADAVNLALDVIDTGDADAIELAADYLLAVYVAAFRPDDREAQLRKRLMAREMLKLDKSGLWDIKAREA